MLKGSAKLVLDLGNSQNRFIVSMGNKVSDPITFPNSFALPEEDYTIPVEYLNNEDLDTEQTSYSFTHHDTVYLSGGVAYREFGSGLLRPSSLVEKYKSITTPLSLELAYFLAYQELSHILGTPMDAIDVDWSVVVCLPSLDFSKSDEMKELVKSVTKVSFTIPEEFHQDIKVTDVRVVPEGLAAFFAAIFDSSGKIKVRPAYKKYADNTIMVLDVGAGTTDLCVIEGFRLLDHSRETIRVGGHNVKQRVSRYLREEGFTVKPSDLDNAVINGTVPDGAVTKDITEIVNKSKREVAKSIVEAVRAFFENAMLPPRSIQYLMVLGGGSLTGNTTPISEYFLEFMKDLSPNISVIDLPDNLSPRLLNVIGANLM